MSFINDIAFDERVDELEVEGHLRVGGDILLHGEFPKMNQQIAALNSSISLKANQSDLERTRRLRGLIRRPQAPCRIENPRFEVSVARLARNTARMRS